MAVCVIKYGGNAMGDGQTLTHFAQAIAALRQSGQGIVIVHGGGPQISHWLKQNGHESHFVNGQRYTDETTLNIAEMVLCGHVNKALVRALQQQGLDSIGISGQDGHLLTAQATPELGLVGRIEQVNTKIIDTLLDASYIPIIAPVACSSEHHPLNINADYSAAHIAAALKAEVFALMTNVAGILNQAGQRIPQASQADITAMIADGTIYGGMLPKVECARTAIQGGCRQTLIMDGTQPQHLQQAIEQPGSIGTLITH